MRNLFATLVFGSLLCWTAPSLAAPTNAEREEARIRFDRGLKLFNQRDDSGALAEFQRAYELVAHPAVLYNIGLVYAAMKRPVDAVQALDRALKQAPSMTPEQKARASRVRAQQAAHLGRIVVRCNARNFQVDVDGVVKSHDRSGALAVPRGERLVTVTATGYSPLRKRVLVAGGATKTVLAKLKPLERALGAIKLNTSVMDAQVSVDGEFVGVTPLTGPIAFEPGPHKVRIERLGFTPFERSIHVGEGSTTELNADLAVDPATLGSVGGRLNLRLSEPDAVVLVNGKPQSQHASLRLPAGRYRLRIERADFFTVERDVIVARGQQSELAVELIPTAKKRSAYRDSALATVRLGAITLGIGAAVAVGSGAFLIWNYSKQRDAESESDELLKRTGPGGDCDPAAGSSPECAGVEERLNIVLDDKDAINARYPFGYVGLGVGLVGIGVGAYLLLSGDDPDKYEPGPESDVFDSVRVSPTVSFDGSGLSLTGRF